MINALAQQYAPQFGVNPQLFNRLLQAESAFNPNAVSPAGAQGIAQVMPATAKQPGFGVEPLQNPFDPNENARFGAEYLGAMLKRYQGDEEAALVAYNAGPGTADKWVASGKQAELPAETQGYLKKILGQKAQLPIMAGLDTAQQAMQQPENSQRGGMIARAADFMIPTAQADEAGSPQIVSDDEILSILGGGQQLDRMAALHEHAQNNIKNKTFVQNSDGSTSTVRSGSVNHPKLNNGEPTLIPFIWNGRFVDQGEAEELAIRSGKQWPVFATHEEATAASMGLSDSIQMPEQTQASDDEILSILSGKKPFQIEGTPEYDLTRSINVENAQMGLEPPQVGPDSAKERFGRAVAQSTVIPAAQLMSGPVGAVGKAIGSDYLSSVPEAVDDVTAQLKQDRKSGAPDGFDFASLGGDIAGTLPLGGLKVAHGVGKVATGINRAVQGGVIGAALTPSTDQSLGTNAAVGAALNTIIPPLVQQFGKKVANSATQSLRAAGVRLTPGQRIGGAAKRFEEGLASIPVAGDLVRSRQRDAFSDFNKVVAKRVLEPIGVKLPDKIEAGHNLVGFVHKTLGNKYDDVLSKASAKVDSQFAQDIRTIMADAQTLPGERVKQLTKIIKNDIAEQLSKGPVSGKVLKRIESKLGAHASRYSKSIDADQQFMGDMLQGIHESFKQLIVRSSPAKVGRELQKTNKAYASFLRMQEAASRTPSESGIFTPEALSGAVRKFDNSKYKGLYARGDALMQDLSDAGREVLGRKVPDSGTPYRLGAIGIAGGMVDPTIAAGVGAVSLPYTRAGRFLTDKALSGISATPNALQRFAPQIGVTGTNALLGSPP